MRQAPLQLVDYWVDLLRVEANRDYKPLLLTKPLVEIIDARHAVDSVGQAEDAMVGSAWKVGLEIELKAQKKHNVPYVFSIRMEGLILAHPDLKGDKLERVVSANGPAMLFGIAREIIRTETGRGRYPPLIMPSTNFITVPSKAKNPARKKKTAAKKKTPAKKPRPSKTVAKKKSARTARTR